MLLQDYLSSLAAEAKTSRGPPPKTAYCFHRDSRPVEEQLSDVPDPGEAHVVYYRG
jgi:hypothetical protein